MDAQTENLTSRMSIHQFSTRVFDKALSYQVLKMTDSLFIWIGLDSSPTMKDLAIAMVTKYDKAPLESKIMGNISSSVSSTIASHLSKRLKKQVYVSCNVPETDQEFLTQIEQRLAEEIHVCPEHF